MKLATKAIVAAIASCLLFMVVYFYFILPDQRTRRYVDIGFSSEQASSFVDLHPAEDGNQTWIAFAVYWKLHPALSDTLLDVTGSVGVSAASIGSIIPHLDNVTMPESRIITFARAFPQLVKNSGFNESVIGWLKLFCQCPESTPEESDNYAVIFPDMLRMVCINELNFTTAFQLFLMEPQWKWDSANLTLCAIVHMAQERANISDVVQFVEVHPDCLRIEFDFKGLFYPLFEYNYRLRDLGVSGPGDIEYKMHLWNVARLWSYILDCYNASTQETYYPLFNAAVDYYSTFFMTTTSRELGWTEQMTYQQVYPVDEGEKGIFKRLLDLYLTWDRKGELFINLSSRQPVKELAVDDCSVHRYLRFLVGIGSVWDLPVSGITIYGYEDWYLNEIWFEGALAHRWSGSYIRYLVFGTYLNKLEEGHEQMWQKMHLNPPSYTELPFNLHLYNCTEYDKTLFSAMALSYQLHPGLSCVPTTAEQLVDLKAIGFSSTTASYESGASGHLSPAVWVSNCFLSSQDSFGGALSSQNFIPMGPIGIERFNKQDADNSQWLTISIDNNLAYDTKSLWINTVVYNTTMPYFVMGINSQTPGWTSPDTIEVRGNPEIDLVVNVTLRSVNEFCEPVMLRFTGLYPEGLNYTVGFDETLVALPPNGKVTFSFLLRIPSASIAAVRSQGGYLIAVKLEARCDSLTYRGRVQGYFILRLL